MDQRDSPVGRDESLSVTWVWLQHVRTGNVSMDPWPNPQSDSNVSIVPFLNPE